MNLANRSWLDCSAAKALATSAQADARVARKRILDGSATILVAIGELLDGNCGREGVGRAEGADGADGAPFYYMTLKLRWPHCKYIPTCTTR